MTAASAAAAPAVTAATSPITAFFIFSLPKGVIRENVNGKKRPMTDKAHQSIARNSFQAFLTFFHMTAAAAMSMIKGGSTAIATGDQVLITPRKEKMLLSA